MSGLTAHSGGPYCLHRASGRSLDGDPEAGLAPKGTPLLRSMLKSRIHRVTVTHADLNQEGSITVDADLLDAADIWPHEEVDVWNVTRGTRLSTYALVGERGSGIVCMKGAAAHLCCVGDVLIVASFAQMAEAEARAHQPRVVRVDHGSGLAGVTRTGSAGPSSSDDRVA